MKFLVLQTDVGDLIDFKFIIYDSFTYKIFEIFCKDFFGKNIKPKKYTIRAKMQDTEIDSLLPKFKGDTNLRELSQS